MKWTRQRCQVAFKTFAMAALSPSWASETTSLTPRRPRRASLRRKSVQKVSASDAPIAKPSTSAVAIDPDRDDHRDRDDTTVAARLHIGRVQPDIGPLALQGPVEEGCDL